MLSVKMKVALMLFATLSVGMALSIFGSVIGGVQVRIPDQGCH